MNKEFVPYELALELKEIGFNEPCFGYYNSLGNYVPEENKINSSCNKLGMYNQYCTTPLYQQAFRWFREKYQLEFNIISILDNNKYDFVILHNTWGKLSSSSYEEAELACLIKLIEIVKNKNE